MRLIPLLAKRGEWLAGEQADFERANEPARILQIDFLGTGRIESAQSTLQFFERKFCKFRAQTRIGGGQIREAEKERAQIKAVAADDNRTPPSFTNFGDARAGEFEISRDIE